MNILILLMRKHKGDVSDKDIYYTRMLDAVIDTGAGRDVIFALCHLFRNLSIDTLHIIGDVYDRGPRPDLIMDELIQT